MAASTPAPDMPPAVDAQGVIHDIGYRSYDGPRQGSSAVRYALFVESLRGAYGLGRSGKSKVVPILMLIAMCLPALVMGLIASLTPIDQLPEGRGTYAAYFGHLQVVVSIFLAAQAPSIMSRDLRHRVVSLYFSRPISRAQYVQAKFAAMSVAVFALLAIPQVLLLAGALLAKFPVRENVPEFLRAIAACAAYSLALSGVALVVAAFTTRRGLGIAAIIVVLLLLGGVQSAIQDIASSTTGHDTLELYSRLISPFSTVNAMSEFLLRADTALDEVARSLVPTIVFTAGWAALVAATYGVLVWRYRKVSVS